MPLDPRSPDLAAEGQARQDPRNFQRAQIFQKHQVEPSVIQPRFRCQPQTPSITRGVQNTQHQRGSLQGTLLSTLQRDPHIDPPEFS